MCRYRYTNEELEAFEAEGRQEASSPSRLVIESFKKMIPIDRYYSMAVSLPKLKFLEKDSAED